MKSNALGNSGGRLYSFGSAPVLIDCNFVIDSTNGNGRGIRNLKGQGVDQVWMNTVSLPPGSPAFGTARGFAVLGASAVSNTGSSVLTGNLGISPGSAITGFPPGTFSGSEHITDVIAANAQASALAAYNDLQARSATTIATELGGQSLSAGVYHAASGTFQITGGLTLTLTGSATDIFVFRTDTTLITGIGAGGNPVITLAGGALASNVYWAVGSSATINSAASSAGAVFKGNIIANTSITATQVGTIQGSLVALNGAVTLSAANAVASQPLSGSPAAGNPNPAPGYALIQLNSNYNRYLGGFSGFVSPNSSSLINVDSGSAALVVGNPYVIASVGHGPAGAVTIQPVADVAGSLAGKYFMLYDSYGNQFAIWFSVAGVGSAPLLGPDAGPGIRGLHYVQQSIASGASAATIGAALVLTIQNLPSGINGVFAFTASGTTTVTVVSTIFQPVAGIPQDGSSTIPDRGPSIPIFFAVTAANATSGAVYTDGSGHLYTVSATIVGGTVLSTSGVGAPIGSNLSKVSGTGDASITFSSAVAGYATGFAFAQTVKDTSLADWNAVGVPKGVTPAVGVSFIAIATGAGGNTGKVVVPSVSGINSIEVIGDPNLSFSPMPQGGSPNVGGWILVQMLSNSVASAPNDGSVCGMCFYVDSKFSPSNVNNH